MEGVCVVNVPKEVEDVDEGAREEVKGVEERTLQEGIAEGCKRL